METITIRYEKLFSVKLVHVDFPIPTTGKNWQASIADEMEIEADVPTKLLFDKYQIHYRFEHDTLLCFVRVETGNDRPFHRLPMDFSARFVLNASGALIAKSKLSPAFGGPNSYHVRVKLKTTTSTTRLNDSLLAAVTSATPELVFHPGYTNHPDHWEKRPVTISGCLAVLDVVTEGSGKNRLFQHEVTQSLNYTVANGKADQHLYSLVLKD